MQSSGNRQYVWIPCAFCNNFKFFQKKIGEKLSGFFRIISIIHFSFHFWMKTKTNKTRWFWNHKNCWCIFYNNAVKNRVRIYAKKINLLTYTKFPKLNEFFLKTRWIQIFRKSDLISDCFHCPEIGHMFGCHTFLKKFRIFSQNLTKIKLIFSHFRTIIHFSFHFWMKNENEQTLSIWNHKNCCIIFHNNTIKTVREFMRQK